MPSTQHACPHFRALVIAHKGNRSVRQLERDAGLPENRIAHWMGRRQRLKEPPRISVCENIASAFDDLSCTDIWRAFCADAGLLPPEHSLTQEQVHRELVIERAGFGTYIDGMLATFQQRGEQSAAS